MSFEPIRLHFSACLTLVLNSSMLKQGSFRTLLTSLTRAVETASLRMSTKLAKEVSSILVEPSVPWRCGAKKREGCDRLRSGIILCGSGSEWWEPVGTGLARFVTHSKTEELKGEEGERKSVIESKDWTRE